MYLDDVKIAFVELGKAIQNTLRDDNDDNDTFSNKLRTLIKDIHLLNPWFTPHSVNHSLEAISYLLDEKKINAWTSNYNLAKNSKQKNIFIIMANNIPLVGMHDFLCVLISSNKAIIKASKGSIEFFELFVDFMSKICPQIKNNISFVDNFVQANIDLSAIIATGSNNTYRYFEYYFRNIPNIIRKNRSSVAILTDKTSDHQIKKLALDIFMYFGMGCRNVSKLYLSKGFDIQRLFKEFVHFSYVINNNKYQNNYMYNRVIYLMKNLKFFENGFVILKNEPDLLDSPISVVFYDYYDSLEQLKKKLYDIRQSIQCIVADCGIEDQIDFGSTQMPDVFQYADDIDTMDFLVNLNT